MAENSKSYQPLSRLLWHVIALTIGVSSISVLGQESLPDATSKSLSTNNTSSSATKLSTLAERIDALVPQSIEALSGSRADDGLLFRRLSLDLRGVVPTKVELDAFAADVSPNRWKTWVKAFLADPLCDEHLVTFLDRTLMLRRPNTQVDRAAWLSYLREQVAIDVALDQLSKQVLYSPWWNQDHRWSQRFYLDRGGDPNLIARDIGRVFLGRDYQCAQCHDHPSVEDYKQIDYHGLLAYVSPGSLAEVAFKDAEGKDQKTQLYVERAAADTAFESVFEKGVLFRSGPRLPEQLEQYEAYVLPDARYSTVRLLGAIPGVALPPKQSRRELLADQISASSNHAFVGNWANRLWALMFGQGLVDPLDMHHPGNPPSHPALYALITEGFLEAEMQPKKFLEQIAISEVYQRNGFTRLQSTLNELPISSKLNASPQISSIRAFVVAKQTEWNNQKVGRDTAEADATKGLEVASDTWRKIQLDRAKLRADLDAAEVAMLDAKKKNVETAAAYAASQKKLADENARIVFLDEATAKLQQAAMVTGVEDAELKQVLTITKQRAEATRGQVPNLEKMVNDSKAASEASVPVVKTTTEKIEEVVAQVHSVQQLLSSADAAMVAARERWSEANASTHSLERDCSVLNHTKLWLDGLEAIARCTEDKTNALLSASALEPQITLAKKAIELAQQELDEAHPAKKTAAVRLARANKAVEQFSAGQSQLEKTLDDLVQAAKLLPENDALTTAQKSIYDELDNRRSQFGHLQSEIDAARKEATASSEMVAQRTQSFNAMKAELKSLADRQNAAKLLAEQKTIELASCQSSCSEHWLAVVSDAATQLQIAGFHPLTPEQLCWSTLRVTGQLDAHIQSELAELEKKSPLPIDADATAKSSRTRQAVRGAFDKLRGNADVYVSLYSSGPDKTQDDFFASVDQALYTANAGTVFSWAAPSNNNPTQQAVAMTDNNQIAELLYWTFLCRRPTEQEVHVVTEQISSAGDQRNAVIQEVAWGLLSSVEFRFCR